MRIVNIRRFTGTGTRLALGITAMAALVAGALALPLANASASASVANASSSMNVTADCEGSGLVGTITGIPGSYPKTFDIWVTDHKPGEGFFLEVPGSRITVIANSSTFNFGPLNTTNVRAGVNTIRVEQSLSTAKSVSIPPCSSPTATPTST